MQTLPRPTITLQALMCVRAQERLRWFPALTLVLIGLYLGACAPEAPPTASIPEAALLDASYVGNAACAGCHEDLYQSYLRTGMGQSVSRFSAAGAPESFDADVAVHDPQSGYTYTPFVRNDTLFQREHRLDAAGNEVYSQAYPAAWVIGSGHATRSYLMDVNGHVTEMPLTWYVDRQQWDLSPGYEQRNHRFSRPINLECMTCHNDLPTYSPFTSSHYTDVPLGISCERCHGPGSVHVEARLADSGPPDSTADPTIINPGHLTRDLQLSVCQQCHLTGFTVFREGEDMTTFRPGTPLKAHRTVFAIEAQQRDPERFGIASHAERLAQSECYVQSEMTCTTCHDPHRSVTELGDDVFNRACQSCHEGQGGETMCSREASHTREEALTGNCVGCHMQKSGTSDIPHVTFTDHWIRRTLPPAQAPEAINRIRTQRTPFTLVRVEGADPAAAPALAELEEAIAYFKLYETMHQLPDYLPMVVQRAREGLSGGADHIEARLAMGRALLEMDSLAAATQVFNTALARYPAHAHLLYWAGAAQLDQGQAQQAIAPLRAALERQPAFTEARLKLAEAQMAAGRLAEAEAGLLRLVEEDPVHLPAAWNNLGFVYLQSQQLDEAARMFEQALALDPDMAITWVNLGSIRLMQGDVAGALAPTERAVALDPSFVPALGNLGLIYMNLGRDDHARLMFEQVLQYQPGDPRAQAMIQQLNQRRRSP